MAPSPSARRPAAVDPPAVIARRFAPWAALLATAGLGWWTGARLVTPGPDDGREHDIGRWADFPPVAASPADAAEAVRRTHAVLDRLERACSQPLPGPADPAAVARLEATLERPLPPAVRATLLRHDGTGPEALLGGYALYSVAQMIARRPFYEKYLGRAITAVDDYVEPEAVGDREFLTYGPLAALPIGRRWDPPGGSGFAGHDPDNELVLDLRTGEVTSVSQMSWYPPGEVRTRPGGYFGWPEFLERLADAAEDGGTAE